MTPITDCALPTCVSVGTLLDDDIYFQDRSAILAFPPSPSERSGGGEGGNA